MRDLIALTPKIDGSGAFGAGPPEQYDQLVDDLKDRPCDTGRKTMVLPITVTYQGHQVPLSAIYNCRPHEALHRLLTSPYTTNLLRDTPQQVLDDHRPTAAAQRPPSSPPDSGLSPGEEQRYLARDRVRPPAEQVTPRGHDSENDKRRLSCWVSTALDPSGIDPVSVKHSVQCNHPVDRIDVSGNLKGYRLGTSPNSKPVETDRNSNTCYNTTECSSGTGMMTHYLWPHSARTLGSVLPGALAGHLNYPGKPGPYMFPNKEDGSPTDELGWDVLPLHFR